MAERYRVRKGEAADFLAADCGGKGTCGKCRIRLTEGFLPVSETERARLTEEEIRAGIRLACCHRVWESDCCVERDSRDAGFQISGCDGMLLSPGSEDGYALAVDLGTTTVVMELVDLRRGQIVREYAFVNPQRQYGADVISRIAAAASLGAEHLRQALLDKMAEIVRTISCPVKRMTVCGNPAMTHIFMGVDPAPIAAAPYRCPVTEYREIRLPPFPFPVQILPPISAYVGSDIVAGLYELGLWKEGTSLLIDLGTNGEVALCKDGRIFCTSAACGPVFEGGNMSCGQGAAAGAVDVVRFDGSWHWHTIGEKAVTGVCGSGYISWIARAVERGFITEGGYMEEDLALHPRARLTQKDVREFQLAKSAMASALICLCQEQEIGLEEIGALHLAGGFGMHVRSEDLFAVGMLPAVLQSRVKAVGNSAVRGCVRYALSQDQKALGEITGHSQSLLLAGNRNFSERFMENMMFLQANRSARG